MMARSLFHAWIGLTWWRITQFFTGLRRTRAVERATEIQEIPARLEWGHDYRRDKMRGDFLTHPRKVQARVNRDAGVGDCEDHAGYWAAVLLKSNLADRVWLGAVFWEKDGKREGHAVVIFTKGTQVFVADYGLPRHAGPATEGTGSLRVSNWEWARVVTAAYGAEPQRALEVEVSLGRRDSLHFGDRRCHSF